jgi:endonuclease/exonuclease/phosphatase family metal-dependent hydrolase
MPVFPKPTVRYSYDVAAERQRLRAHKPVRTVPDKAAGALLLGSWNIANFGAQKRRECDIQLIAEMLSWFDISAVQECRDNFADLYDVLRYLGPKYRVVMSDAGGNNERLVFIFDGTKLSLLDEIGEVAFAPSMAQAVTLPGVSQSFTGFDRAPYLASFNLIGTPLSVQLLNVHLFFGSDSDAADIDRRALETTAVAKWTAERNKSKYAGARELIAVGDFNMPKAHKDGTNIVYSALTSRGLVTPTHSGQIGSSIASDNHFDQVAVFPSTTKAWFVDVGVFDYDAVVFQHRWTVKGQEVFNGYLRYYLSDHRPMWVELRPR